MTPRAKACAGALLAALATTSAASAADDPKKEAQTLFEIAVKQADAGDNAAALSSFRAAYDKHPSYRVLYNIGKLCSRMADAQCAVRAYDQYLREGGSDVPSKRKREVESEIKALSRTLAMVSVKSNVKGADVTIDDEVVGQTPLPGPVAVSGGSHKIAVVQDGVKSDKSITVVAGESATVELDLSKSELASAAPAAADPAPDPDAADPEPAADSKLTLSDSSSEPKSFPVVPWAITGVLAVGTVVTGLLASSAYSDYQAKRDEFPITRDDLEGAQGKARDLMLLSGFLGAGTVVSLGVASYFTFFSSGSTSGPPPSKARVGVAVGPTGFSVHGVMP